MDRYNELVDRYNGLVDRYNEFVYRYNGLVYGYSGLEKNLHVLLFMHFRMLLYIFFAMTSVCNRPIWCKMSCV